MNLGKNKKICYNIENQGYITLISVLIVSAVGVLISTSLIWLGLGNSLNSFSLEQENKAKALANLCAEEALQQISDSIPFAGSNTLSLGAGACSYIVIDQGGQNREIQAQGTVNTTIRRVRVNIDYKSREMIVGDHLKEVFHPYLSEV